jgi:hypothetical protein
VFWSIIDVLDAFFFFVFLFSFSPFSSFVCVNLYSFPGVSTRFDDDFLHERVYIFYIKFTLPVYICGNRLIVDLLFQGFVFPIRLPAWMLSYFYIGLWVRWMSVSAIHSPRGFVMVDDATAFLLPSSPCKIFFAQITSGLIG